MPFDVDAYQQGQFPFEGSCVIPLGGRRVRVTEVFLVVLAVGR